MDPAVFLDRDGVLIENRSNYVRSWEDVAILPGALESLARLKTTGYKVIIVTNQSAVGRGIITMDEAREINDRFLQVIRRSGGRIDASYMCPHAPPQGCDCRKPRPGLIMKAAAEHSLDLTRSLLVGDALSDIQAGQNAGIPTNILVKTGRGDAQSQLPDAQTLKPFLIMNRFADAVDYLIDNLLS
jgi:D-glycero-D-manno-heptose 1,7-bisphosphate phosphatase